MTLKAVASFDRRWTVFWATTYSFELPFFESYLLPRLGEPPLNATLLVDADRYADALQNLSAETPWRGERANRDYLVRGVAPTRGAFHPKTYFFGNDQTGLLLVGSGNLTMGGLETGKEVFAAFNGADEVDRRSIHTWRAWMDQVVTTAADPAISDRWRDAQMRARWVVGPVDGSAFVHNWDRPFIDQLLDGVDAPVDELHLTAPFFDERAAAVRALIERGRPRRIEMLVARDASVDGRALANALEASGAEVVIHGLAPDTYVHGKLVGLVWGDRGRILSGSANLSTAAVLRAVARDSSANVECGAITDVDPPTVRAAFVPPPPPAGLAVIGRDLASIGTLRFARSDEPGFPVRLRSAAWLADGRIRAEPEGAIDAAAYRLSDGSLVVDMEDWVTTGGMADRSHLVWLVDAEARQASNKVAVDEPLRLKQILEDRGQGTDRPAGVDAADLETPVGQMLARLHAACIFDFDDTPTARRIARAADTESEDPEFWDRLAREELHQDPRTARYLQLHGSTPLLDGVFLDIARMLESVPGMTALHRVDPLVDEAARPGTGTPWTPDRRLQVRLFNLLERWCAALSDPRLQWISQMTPVGNFAALAGALRECWARGYLPEHRVVTLVGVLLTAFFRDERRPGFLGSLDDADRTTALQALAGSSSAGLFTALVYLSVRPSRRDLLSYLFSWQPALVDAIACDVLRASDLTTVEVQALGGQPVSAQAIVDRISWASIYLDDARWGEVVSRETRLPVVLTARGFAERYGATISVGAGVNLLADPRVVEIVRRGLAYRRTKGCVVESGTDRMSIQLGDVLAVRIGGVTEMSDDLVTADRLDAMAGAGSAFADLMAVVDEAAS